MQLEEFFQENPRLALAFSGGTDSALVLYLAKKYGCDLHAYFVKGPFQPRFELHDARRLSDQYDVPMTVLEFDALAHPQIRANAPDRCYHCKHAVFECILHAAQADGYTLLIDGTNASDDDADRPGMQALKELQVRSPLRECGITKPQVRALSREAGLFTWDKPAYACLATRIPTGTELDADTLQRVEYAEDVLHGLGFSDFRVRVVGTMAKIQLPEAQFCRVLEQREHILKTLGERFADVVLDLKPR